MIENQDLTVEDATRLLIQEGYEIVGLQAIWRNITGKVKKNGTDLFFKIAVNPDNSPSLQNEFAWNGLLANKPLDAPIHIPKNYESGKFTDCFWFTCEFVEGSVLISPEYEYIDGVPQRGPRYRITDPKRVESQIPRVAQTLAALIGYHPDKSLPADSQQEESLRVQAFWGRIDQWVKESGRDLSNLVEFIRHKFKDFSYGPIHGDFTPWHLLLDEQDNLYLIDAEHSRMNGIKFYDLAYCYHRLYAAAQSPHTADLLIKEFSKLHSFTPEDKNCFYGILAQRLIGGYAESINNKRYIVIPIQDELTARVLKEDIL